MKFYKDFKKAVSDVVFEIKNHFEIDYLRNEFAAVTNKLDKRFPFYTNLVKLLDPNTSLDDVFACLCVPVLLTYNSDIVSAHKEFNAVYLKEIATEVQSYHNYFVTKIKVPIKIHLFLLPLEDKDKLSLTLLEKLSAWQKI